MFKWYKYGSNLNYSKCDNNVKIVIVKYNINLNLC